MTMHVRISRLLPLLALTLSLTAGCSDDPVEVPPCVTDDDCRTGERCAPDGQCIFGAECVIEDECVANDPRTTCNLTTFMCDFREGFGDECDPARPCPFGQFCSNLLGLCLDAASSRDCVRRSQCPANQICDRDANKCILDPGCYGEAFCEDGEICDIVNRTCRGVAMECTACNSEGRCIEEGELCFVETEECLRSSEEPSCRMGEFCDPLGRCVQCSRSADCGPGLFCNVSVGRCESNIQCVDDPSLCPSTSEITCVTCESPEECNPRTRRCEAPPEPCTSDIDCPSDQLCDQTQDPPICVPRLPDCLNDVLDEPRRNDDIGSASLIDGETLRIEELKACPGDQDWYRLDVPAGTYLTVDARFRHADGDLDLELYLPNGRTIIDQSRTVTDNERLELEVGTDLTLFARVFFAAPGVNAVPYELIVARDAGGVCADDGNEPDDQVADAKALINVQTYEGRLCPADPDWFVLRMVPAGTRVQLDLDFVDNLGDLDLEVFRPGQTQPLLSSLSVDDDEQLIFDAPYGGDFFVRVAGKGADTNVYTLRATLTENAGVTCLDDALEANDTPLTASSTSAFPSGIFPGTLCAGDDDWFRFSAQPGQAVTLELGFEPGADLDLRVYDGNITEPNVSPMEISAGVNPREYIGFRTFLGGNFLARVSGHTDRDASPYELRFDVSSRGICQPDTADATGQGETQETAFSLPLPPTRLDDLTLCAGDAQDWYRIFASAGFMNVLRLNYVPDDGQLDFDLRQADGSLLFTTGGLAPEIPREVQINVPGVQGGFALLFMRVSATSGFDPSYSLSHDLVPIFSCDPDVAEPNNLRSTPSTITATSANPIVIEDLTLCANTRDINNNGDSDYYLLLPPAPGARIDARIDFEQGDLLMELFSPGAVARACVNQGEDRCFSDGFGLSETISFTATTAAPYFLRVDSVYSSPNVQVRPPDASTAYDLRVEYTLPGE